MRDEAVGAHEGDAATLRVRESRTALLNNPHALLIRTSLALGTLVGFALGLYLIVGFAFGLPLVATSPALVQVHGQVQALGFVGLFILGVGAQILPRFHASQLPRPRQVALGGLVLGTGLVLRAVSQPIIGGEPLRGAALILSGLLELAGVVLALSVFAAMIRRSVQPRETPLLPITMGGSLMAALLLNVVVCVELAQGSLVAPFGHDEALLHLELWGFASTMVLAVAGRIFPRFLLLQPTREGLMLGALALWLVGSFGVPLAWLFGAELPVLRAVAALAQLAGACGYVVAIRLYEQPLRKSGMPHVTDPTRLWARVAFALVLLAAAANFGLALAEAAGYPAPQTGISAARHALAQGFLLPVIVVMAARILPGYSGEMLHRPRLLAGLVWTLFAGAALRFAAEFAGGYAPGWGALSALGGTLGVAAFLVFAWGLWRASGRAASILRTNRIRDESGEVRSDSGAVPQL